MGSEIYQHEKPACKLLHLAKYIWNSNTQYFSSFPSFFWDFTKYLRRSFNFCYIQNFKTFAPPHKLRVTLLNLPNSFKWSSALKDKDDRWIMNFAPLVFRLNTLLTKYWVKKDLNISHIMKMVKHNLKILQYLHRKIFKVCLSIFLSLFIKVTDYKWIFYVISMLPSTEIKALKLSGTLTLPVPCISESCVECCGTSRGFMKVFKALLLHYISVISLTHF